MSWTTAVNAATDYNHTTIGPGETVSSVLRWVCIAANGDSYLAEINGKAWEDQNWVSQFVLRKDLDEQTDWVWTKVRIYLRQFNLMYEKYKKADWSITFERFQKISNKLMYRMMLDLLAMIVDDFRHGHVAMSITDIIDINHVKINEGDTDKMQWTVWMNAMAYALNRTIRETGIAINAWETAILKMGDSERKQMEMARTALKRLGLIEELLARKLGVEWVQQDTVTEVLALINPEGEEKVDELVKFLTDTQKMVVRLFYVEGKEIKEIAEHLTKAMHLDMKVAKQIVDELLVQD